MHQFIKILLIIIAISVLFWLFNSQIIGNNSSIEKLIEKQDQLSTSGQENRNSDAPPLPSHITKEQPQEKEASSQMITTPPVSDNSGMPFTQPDSQSTEQGLGGIDHILTPEEREAMMEFAPEAGDDGTFGEAPEAGDTGIYSDGPGVSDTIIGDEIIPGTSLDDSFNSGMGDDNLENTSDIFAIPPEESQP